MSSKVLKRGADALIAIVALLHVGFMLLEIVFWDGPVGWAVFGTNAEFSRATAVLAMNQGLYNGFLAAGLVWGLVTARRDLKTFFLCCVIAAGFFGGATASLGILLVQAMPALLALSALRLVRDAKAPR